ncbi:MAG: hypothetical protein AB7F76_04425 [Parvibaculaceae bacterium]
MHKISFAGRKIPVPGHPILRLLLGAALIAGGFLGFLPVLGFWMIPLGLLILAVDFPIALRIKRRLDVALGRWLKRRSPKWARRFGYAAGKDEEPAA